MMSLHCALVFDDGAHDIARALQGRVYQLLLRVFRVQVVRRCGMEHEVGAPVRSMAALASQYFDAKMLAHCCPQARS